MATRNRTRKSEDTHHDKYHPLGYARQYLTFTGLWPVDYKGVKKTLYNFYFGMGFSYFCLFVGSQVIETVISLQTGMEAFASSVGITLAHFLLAWRGYIVKSDTIGNIIRRIEVMEQEMLSSYGNNVCNIYTRNAKFTRRLEISFLCFISYGNLLYYTEPLIIRKLNLQNTTSGHSTLIVESWIPFDQDAYFWGAYAIQGVGCFFATAYGFFSQMLYFSILRFIVSYFEILNYLFENFSEESDLFANKQMTHTRKQSQELFLKKLIQEHQSLIKLVEDVNVSLKTVVMLEFFVSSFQLATLIFQLLQVSGLKLLKIISYISVISWQLYVLYWNGNELAFQSEQITMSIQQSEWNTYPIKLVKMMQLVMLRAQKPILLDIGFVGKVQFNALFQIYKAIYSYFCIFANRE